ncbi:unnamed protein product, partial [Scytosiphon promiscuus]
QQQQQQQQQRVSEYGFDGREDQASNSGRDYGSSDSSGKRMPSGRLQGGGRVADCEGAAAAAAAGDGGCAGEGEDGERTSADLMSAQALFGGNIPGLTSFGRAEINSFHREKAALLSAARAAGDTEKRKMIEETTPDVLNAKGLLMFLRQSPSSASSSPSASPELQPAVAAGSEAAAGLVLEGAGVSDAHAGEAKPERGCGDGFGAGKAAVVSF